LVFKDYALKPTISFKYSSLFSASKTARVRRRRALLGLKRVLLGILTMEQPSEKSGFRYLVRVMETDLDGKKQLADALTKIKGVSYAIANTTCILTGIDKRQKTGELSDEEVKKLNTMLDQTSKLLPKWMLNRRRDVETGLDLHIFTTDIDVSKEMDIRTMKKIRSYKGVRHSLGQPVRGQRTKSHFRKNKGKGLGVVKSREQKPAMVERAAAADKEKK
jgi:small subunit ribosomal protein S13